MATSVIRKQHLITETLTGRTSSTAYSGWYFCDLTPSQPIDRLRSFYVSGASSNRPAFVQQVSGNLRVYTVAASTDVTVVAVFA